MIETTDSFYRFVKGRIQSFNPQRKVSGILDAMDWPPRSVDATQPGVDLEAFYLLTMGAVPVHGKSMYAGGNPVLVHTVQWTWLIKGTDLSSGEEGHSRGDRYRTNYAMMKELLYGLSPFYGEKLSFAPDASGNVIATSLTPREFIWWTPADFASRIDRRSGLVYGIATVQITDLADAITS